MVKTRSKEPSRRVGGERTQRVGADSASRRAATFETCRATGPLRRCVSDKHIHCVQELKVLGGEAQNLQK